jgi:hypothetical protein
MVLQLEDCVGVLKHLHPQYDYLFLFDHSRDHDQQREDGLNVKNDKKLSGPQRKMRNTFIKKEKRIPGSRRQTITGIPRNRYWAFLDE